MGFTRCRRSGRPTVTSDDKVRPATWHRPALSPQVRTPGKAGDPSSVALMVASPSRVPKHITPTWKSRAPYNERGIPKTTSDMNIELNNDLPRLASYDRISNGHWIGNFT